MALIDYIINEYLQKENEKLEIISEGNVCKFGEFKIDMHESSHYTGQGGAYFYVNNDSKERRARILFEQPKYIFHTNIDGYKDLFLSSSEKAKLIEILKQKPTKTAHDGNLYNTNWEFLIYERNYFNHTSQAEIHKYMNLPINKCPKHIIPITIPIPNYMLLSK